MRESEDKKNMHKCHNNDGIQIVEKQIAKNYKFAKKSKQICFQIFFEKQTVMVEAQEILCRFLQK